MDSKFRQCRQCGKVLPVDQYRSYYGNRKGTYKYCKNCERINSREKYLAKKQTLSDDETKELEKIHKLWTVQRANGLRPPRLDRRERPVADMVDSLLDDYNTTAIEALVSKPAPVPDEAEPAPKSTTKFEFEKASRPSATHALSDTGELVIPEELQMWLVEPLVESPEYYEDEIYEKLKNKYRPVIEFNQTTLMPVYDDTYKDVLDKILDRFYDYEDSFDWPDEEE